MGISIRSIAFSCKCSTATVVTLVGRVKARGLEWPLPEEMGDAAKAEVDHDRVDREMERPGAPEGGTAVRPLPYRIDVASRSLQGWLPYGFA